MVRGREDLLFFQDRRPVNGLLQVLGDFLLPRVELSLLGSIVSLGIRRHHFLPNCDKW